MLDCSLTGPYYCPNDGVHLNLQIQLVRVLCKLGLIPIPIRRGTSSEVESLLGAVGFQAVESEEIYKDASSYFVVAKKLQKT